MKRLRPVWQLLSIFTIVAIANLSLFGRVNAQQAAPGDDQGPVVHITWPNEGETLYAGPTSLLYSAPIRGFIDVTESLEPGTKVTLEVVQDSRLIGTLTQPLLDATFEFLVTVNPSGSDGNFPSEHLTCGYDCHLPGDMDLEVGELTLRVFVQSPAGDVLTRAERNIVVDHSTYATIPVELIAEEQGEPVPAGVTVRGASWIYMWRARYALAQSAEGGQTNLSVEALRHAPLEYVVEVEPTVVDGVLYEGVDSGRVMVLPGASVSEPVTLTVVATRGAIAGRVSPATAAGDTVWAICDADGHSVQAPVAEDGSFNFEDIALDRYRLALDQGALLPVGYAQIGRTLPVDLLSDVAQDVTIQLATISPLAQRGRVVDQAEQPLPFAWMTPVNGSRAYAVAPDTGEYTWFDGGEERASIIVQAPGYYSRAAIVDLGDAEGAEVFALTPRPGTTLLSWGEGQLTLPDDSDVVQGEGTIALNRGWIWGSGGGTESVAVQVGAYMVEIASGSFAIEYRPAQRGWFYLPEGEARVVERGSGRVVAVEGGQMVNLMNEGGPVAVPYDAVVVAALQEPGGAPVTQSWEPGLRAQVRDGVARTGVGVAQIITFVTYILVCISIVAAPAYLIYLRATRKKHQS